MIALICLASTAVALGFVAYVLGIKLHNDQIKVYREILKSNGRMDDVVNGIMSTIRDHESLMSEYGAMLRKNTASTFKLEDMRPDPVVPSISNGGIKIGRTNIDLNGDKKS